MKTEKTDTIKAAAKKIFILFCAINTKISQVFNSLEAVEKTVLREKQLSAERFAGIFVQPYIKNLGDMTHAEEYILKIVGPATGDLQCFCCGYKHDYDKGPLIVQNGLIDGNYIGSCYTPEIKFTEPPLIAATVKALENSGEKWPEVANEITTAMYFTLNCFYRIVSEISGQIFNDPETTMVVEEYKKVQEIANLRAELGEAKKEKERYATEVQQLQKQLSAKSAELSQTEQQLAEFRRDRQTKEEIAREMAETLAAKSELALAKLRLAAQKAVADLAATKGISKSRKFAQIRKNLEAAIYPSPVAEDYEDDGWEDEE